MPQEEAAVPNPLPSLHDVSSAQEARIQRLEEHVSELRTGQAELRGDLKGLGAQLETGFGKLADRLDNSVKPLSDTLSNHIKEDTLSRVKIDQIEEVVQTLDNAHKARDERWAFWKKTFGGIVLGGASIGMKELIVWLIHFLR